MDKDSDRKNFMRGRKVRHGKAVEKSKGQGNCYGNNKPTAEQREKDNRNLKNNLRKLY